jgi:putative aminopeptidase FrvX
LSLNSDQIDFLQQLSDLPGVGTACGCILEAMQRRFGSAWTLHHVQDGFGLFHRADFSPSSLRVVLVAHLDEIGGVAYGPRPDGTFNSRCWGAEPSLFAAAQLQQFDWLATGPETARPVNGVVELLGDDARLVLQGEGIVPYRTAFTFVQSSRVEGDLLHGKALDPRATAFAAAEAAIALNDPEVGALFVMAEECDKDLARKAVVYLDRNVPQLRLLVNADVPGVANLGEGHLERPAVRIFEGRTFIDPSFGIRMHERLTRRGIVHHLTGARSGSQTVLFTPLASTISVAMPALNIHTPCATMSLTGISRCIDLLKAVAEERTIAAPSG